jgi:uncharacterized protein
MILKSTLESIYAVQQQELSSRLNQACPRDLMNSLTKAGSHINILSGIRRCGKSTLLLLLLKDHFPGAAYFNFEEPQLAGFSLDDFSKLLDVMGKDRPAYFFDEIQIIPQWEIFIRSLHDRGKIIFVTGSNASMLSRELGTRLTGRYLLTELFPFSFGEFLTYTRQQASAISLLDYLQRGGFPEYLQQNKRDILHQLFRDILFRDIVVRHNVKNSSDLEQLALWLLSNVGNEMTFNSLRKILGIASVTTVSDFMNWLQDSYLMALIPRFSYSAKSMMVNPKKIYAIDTGLVRAVTLSKSEDRGHLLENMVFLELRRRGMQISYFREKGECDFVVFDNQQFKMAIQVTLELNADNQQRELNGLLEALEFLNKESGLILTLDQKDEVNVRGKNIQILPLWEWLTNEGFD